MEITIKEFAKFCRAKIRVNKHVTYICLHTEVFMNCQVGTISNIEQLLHQFSSSDILSIVKKLCVGRKNIAVIDVRQGFLEKVNNTFKNNVINTMPYKSTSGSNRVLVMFKTAYL
mgnify:CR=1 FL=1